MLFPYLLKVSLLLAVLTLGYRWMVQFETFSKLNRALLWLNVVAAWTIPLIPMPDWGPVKMQTEFHETIPKIAQVIPVVKQQIVPYNSAPAELTRQNLSSPDLMECMLLIYLAGVTALSIFFLFQVGGIFRLILQSEIERSDRKLFFVRNKHIKSPYSFFRWIVINPENHSPEELRHIVAHEAEHALQWHSIDLMISEIQRIVLWFNPFAWFHQKQVQANLEYLADRAVLDGGIGKKQYQYSLLTAVMQGKELPLTTSFAQSLLKNRIKMMNRKPSHYLAWGKYAALIAVLYLSSAFVAPFKHKLVALAPKAIKPVVATLIEEKVSVAAPAEKVVAKAPEKVMEASIPPPETVTEDQEKKRVRGILIQNDTLYWSVSPTMGLEDFIQMRKAANKFGGEFVVNKVEYDPLQQFITSVGIVVSAKGSRGQGDTGGNRFMPIEGYSGFMLKNGIGVGARSIPAQLQRETNADYQRALGLVRQNEMKYFKIRLSDEIGINTSVTYKANAFEGKYAASILQRSGIGKSEKSTFLIRESDYQGADLYLDTQKTTLEDLNALSTKNITEVEIIEDQQKKKYVLVSTR